MARIACPRCGSRKSTRFCSGRHVVYYECEDCGLEFEWYDE